MAGRWTDKDAIDALSDDDLLLVADASQPDGQRDRTVLVQRLRAWLQTGQTLWGTITGNLQDQTDLWNAIQGAQLKTPKSVTFTSNVYNVTLGDERSILTVGEGGYSNPPTLRIRVPAHATVAFPIGTRIELTRLIDPNGEGAAIVILEGASGVTVDGHSSLEQWRLTTLVKITESTWLALRSA